MCSRHLLVAVTLSLGLPLGLALQPTHAEQGSADDVRHPTAVELYEQAMEAYDAGDYAVAQQLLDRLDPMQLPRTQRSMRSQALERIDEYVLAQANSDNPNDVAAPAALDEPAVDQLMAEADAAAREGQLEHAASLYGQVSRHEDADATTRATARARRAEMQRRIDGAETQTQRALRAARSHVQAGDYERASEQLEAVRASGVGLGWFDQRELERLEARVAEAQMPAEPAGLNGELAVNGGPEPMPEEEHDAPAPEAEAPAAEPALSDDLLEQFRRDRAEQRVAEARTAAEQNQYTLAIRHYEAALQLGPEDPEQIRAELEAVRGERAAAQAPQEPIEREAERLELLREQVVALYEERLDQAQRLRQRREFLPALDAVERAKIVLDDNRGLLGEVRYTRLSRQAEELSIQLAAERRRAEEERLRQVERTAAEEAELRRQQIRQEREREIEALLRRAWALRLDMEYEHALELVNQALGLDPSNFVAQMMQQSIQDAKVLTDQRRTHRRRAVEIAEHSRMNLEASVPYSDLIRYPADWPQISERRWRDLEDTGRESEEDRLARELLQQRIPVSFDATRLDSVIDFLRNTTGADFEPNWAALELAGVDQDMPITLQLQNRTAEQVLRRVLRQAGGAAQFDPIGYSILEGTVYISTESELEQETEVRIYDVRDLLVNVPSFDDMPDLGVGGGGGGTGGGGGGASFGGSGRDDAQEAREGMIEEITEMIRESVGRFDEWVEMGGDISSLREFNGNLIVRTTPRNHIAIMNLLDQLRATRAIQINVEARFLLVDQSFLERVGVDLDAQFADPGGNFGPIRMAQDHIAMGAPSPSFLSPFESPSGAGIPPATPGEQIGGLFPPTGRAFDLTASYLSDLEVSLLVTATQRHRQSISLTAPRVTFFNGQRGFVQVVREVSYVSDLTLVPDTTGFQPTFDQVQVGVLLDVEGVVSADRRYVTLTLEPALAKVDLIETRFPVAGTITRTDPNDPDVTFEEPFVVTGVVSLPETEVTSAGATVSIPDRGTLLLGGQRLVEDVEVEAGVPVLSKLPFINRLFTNRGVAKDERTLLILIKPTILIQQEEEDRRFPGLLDNPGLFNVGR